MKVLLFVQTGDARPRVQKHYARAWASEPTFLDDVREYGHGYRCDRWWLVECENAADGRWIITFDGKVFDEQGNPIGRILASGGKP